MARALILAAALLTACAAPSRADRQPNIVLVLIDDLGWRDLSCQGSEFFETPNIDRLAREGVRFTDAYAAAPVCSPTRACLMTGKHPARLKLTDFLKGKRTRPGSQILPAEYANYLPLEETTVAELLRARGYATGHIGKWHLGHGEHGPDAQGFEVNVGGGIWGHPLSFFWPAWKDAPTIEGRHDGEYLPDRLADEACAFIERNAQRPFFLQLAHYAVHTPIEYKADKAERYRTKAGRLPGGSPQDNWRYAAMVESVDESVGRVLATLARLGLDERTIVLFTSDNGGLSVEEGRYTPATSNAPLRAGKGYLYEGGIRVPLLARWLGVTPPGTICKEPVGSADFLPTACALAGAPLPAGPLDGVDLTPLLRDPRAPLAPRALFWHYPHFSNQGGSPGAAVREGRYKLIERYETGAVELFDLEEDLGESRDLAAAMPERAHDLQQRLARWRADVDANMPRPAR
jgi:arylsulfatase A-like enzyme